MDPITHTLIALACLFALYLYGIHKGMMSTITKTVNHLIDSGDLISTDDGENVVNASLVFDDLLQTRKLFTDLKTELEKEVALKPHHMEKIINLENIYAKYNEY